MTIDSSMQDAMMRLAWRMEEDHQHFSCYTHNQTFRISLASIELMGLKPVLKSKRRHPWKSALYQLVRRDDYADTKTQTTRPEDESGGQSKTKHEVDPYASMRRRFMSRL